MTGKQVVLSIIGGIALLLALVYGYIALYSDVAPRFQNAQFKVFEQTQSFIQGKITSINALKLDYEREKDQDVRASLKQMIVSEAFTIDPERLPVELRSFIRGL